MDQKTKYRQRQEIEKEIYLYYVRYMKKYGYSPSYKEVAEHLNISVPTVSRRVRSMIDSGLFKTEHPEDSRAVTVAAFEFRMKRRKDV